MRKFLKNRRAAASITAVILVALAALVFAYVGGMALNELAVRPNTSVNAIVRTMFQVVLPILLVVGVALRFLPEKKG